MTTREAVSAYLKSMTRNERLRLAARLGLTKENVSCATAMCRRTRRNQWLCPSYVIEIIAKHMEAA